MTPKRAKLTRPEVKGHAFWTKVWDEEKASIKELKGLPAEHVGGGAL